MELQHQEDSIRHLDGQGAILPGGNSRQLGRSGNIQSSDTIPNINGMTINNKFKLGELVYLKTDPEQMARIIISLQISVDGGLLYKLAIGMSEQWHYEVEISREKDIVLATQN